MVTVDSGRHSGRSNHDPTRASRLTRCQAIIRDTWWLPVTFQMKARLDASRVRATEVAERFEVAAGLRARLGMATKAAEGSICEACGQPLSDDLRERFRNEVYRLEQDLKLLDIPARALADAMAEQRSLKAFAEIAPADLLRGAESAFRRANIDIRRLNNETYDVQPSVRAGALAR